MQYVITTGRCSKPHFYLFTVSHHTLLPMKVLIFTIISITFSLSFLSLDSSSFQIKKTLKCTNHNRSNNHNSLTCHYVGSPKQQYKDVEPWAIAKFDYSAANEFVQAHYGENAPSNPYFAHDKKKIYDELHKVEEEGIQEFVYNARNGIIHNNNDNHDEPNGMSISFHNASLLHNGFALHYSPTSISNYHNLSTISENGNVFKEELECLFQKEVDYFGSTKSFNVTFWNPMVRSEEFKYNISGHDGNNIDSIVHETTTPKASIASMVHIDTDVGAYPNIKDFITLVEKNRLDKNTYFPTDEIVALLERGHRFAIVNFWRNINFHPISQSPLAILYTNYDQIDSSDQNENYQNQSQKNGRNINKLNCFPYVAPNTGKSKWYTFPQMTGDECLIFLQYDRLTTQISDLWHCALTNYTATKQEGQYQDDVEIEPRKSFDVRAFIVFDELVPLEFDRLHPNRLRPGLTFDESGCFCDEQAAKRKT